MQSNQNPLRPDMKMETYKTAEELGTTEVIRTAIIRTMHNLAEEKYLYFDMMSPSYCAISTVATEYRSMPEYQHHARQHQDLVDWYNGDEISAIYVGGFLFDGRRIKGMEETTQKDAAWILHHYLTTGRCPEPAEYADRQTSGLVLEGIA